MIRTWKLLGYPAILAAALTPSLWADDAGKQNSETKSKVTLEDVNESLKGVQKKLGEYMLNTSIMGEDVRVLKEKVAQLQRDVDSLRGRATSSNYQPIPPTPGASAGTSAGAGANASAATGRIHLVNTWPERITVFLNDRSFPIEPNHEITVADVPSGQFTYEILSQRPDNSILQIAQKSPRTLAANETFTIHVHPH